MSKKVFIKSFGCQMNEYDSDKMVDLMHAAEGYERTDNPEEADLVLFNTCSVREKAQEKVFSDLGRIKHLKARGVQLTSLQLEHPDAGLIQGALVAAAQTSFPSSHAFGAAVAASVVLTLVHGRPSTAGTRNPLPGSCGALAAGSAACRSR